MKNEHKLFIEENKKALLKNYADYLESMIEDENYDAIESFTEWAQQEYKIAVKEAEQEYEVLSKDNQ